jgi:hypothetical protein
VLTIFVDGDIFGKVAYKTHTIEMVTAKQIDPTFAQILVRGIGKPWFPST